MKKRLSKNIEWSILICTILLIIIGLIALFSATQTTEYDEFKKQILWIGPINYNRIDCPFFSNSNYRI